jgi:L-ascorbate metabolism protein UlaG (beta-lactamase superfamily)
LKRLLIVLAVLGSLVGGAAGYIASVPAFGKHAEGERQRRIEESPHWRDGRFRTEEPMWSNLWGSLRRGLAPSPTSAPSVDVPRVVSRGELLRPLPTSGLRITWFGHSSTLIEIDEVRVLTDPIWSERASPVDWAGPKRWYEPVLPLADLPKLDAVLVSHDHYDHLDMGSVSALAVKGTRFIVPLGIGAHLAYWGVPDAQITELDWWQRARVGPIDLIATPARHASGRINPQANQTLFAGYAIVGPKHRVYFSGDTGFFSGLATIGKELGPFDVTLIESGQYNATWPDWHIGPEQAVEAHRLVRGRVLIPIHWGLFTLAPHGWTEPVERVLAAAKCSGAMVMTPRPGQSVEPETQSVTTRWWPEVAWESGSRAPIVATRDGTTGNRFTLPACPTGD